MENTYILTSDGELYHWGVKGMKWGVRRYQDKSGRLTAAGKKRRTKEEKAADKQLAKDRKNAIRELDSIAIDLNNVRRTRDVAVDALKNNKFGDDETRVRNARYIRVMLDRELDNLTYSYQEKTRNFIDKYGKETYENATKRFLGVQMREADEYVNTVEND